MNQEAKVLWLQALRSGQYEQGKGYLNKDGKLCCLGVLCQVAIAAGVEVETSVAAYAEDGTSVTAYDDADLVLPDSVATWAGVEDYNPQVNITGTIAGDNYYTSLSSLNDGEPESPEYPMIVPHTFLQIADIIENQL